MVNTVVINNFIQMISTCRRDNVQEKKKTLNLKTLLTPFQKIEKKLFVEKKRRGRRSKTNCQKIEAFYFG